MPRTRRRTADPDRQRQPGLAGLGRGPAALPRAVPDARHPALSGVPRLCAGPPRTTPAAGLGGPARAARADRHPDGGRAGAPPERHCARGERVAATRGSGQGAGSQGATTQRRHRLPQRPRPRLDRADTDHVRHRRRRGRRRDRSADRRHASDLPGAGPRGAAAVRYACAVLPVRERAVEAVRVAARPPAARQDHVRQRPERCWDDAGRDPAPEHEEIRP